MGQINNLHSNINILHISRAGSEAGGSVAYRMHKIFLDRGCDSRILVKENYGEFNENIYGTIESNSFFYYFQKVKRKLSFLNFSRVETNTDYYFYGVNERKKNVNIKDILKKITYTPEVIILYFIDDFINYENIFELYSLTNAKIYLYPMDMGQLTGGCHYNWDCEGYTKDCKICPAIITKSQKKIANENLSEKIKQTNKLPLSILAASQWMYENISRSILFKNNRTYDILLPIDSEIFLPYPSEEARQYFGLDKDKKIIFIGAQFLKDKRKGLVYLLQALNKLFELLKSTPLENQVQLLIAGRKDDVFLENLPFSYRFVGLIDNVKELPLAYSAASIFACSSIQDAGPMMINESLMCGTPVVAFDMGVAKNIVISKVTGYRAKIADYKDFAFGLFYILLKNNKDYEKIRIECRNYAISEYSNKVIFNKLMNIFRETKTGFENEN